MMLKREGTEMVDNRNRTDIFLDGERILEREQHNGTWQLGKFRRDDDDKGLSGRGNDIASKFSWTCLLKGSDKSILDGVERGFRDNEDVGCGRRYEGLVERSIPVDRELNRNVSSYSRNDGGDDYHGVARNVTNLSVLEPKYVGNVRNLSDFRAIDRRGFRNMNSLPVENAEFQRIKRVDHSVEGADPRRQTRSETGRSVDYGGRFPGREYPRDLNRQCGMKSYEDGNSVRYLSEDNSCSLTPRSQSNDQHTQYRGIQLNNKEGYRSHQEGFRHPSDGLGTTKGSVPTSSLYDSHRKVCSSADTCACPIPSMGITNRRVDYDQTSDRHLWYIDSDNQVSGNVYRRVLSKDNFDACENFGYYEGRGNLSENDVLNPPLPRYKYNVDSPERHLEEDRLHRSDHTLEDVSMVDINYINKTAHEMEYDGVDLESMNEYLKYRPDDSHETLRYKEYPSEFDAYGLSHEDERWNDVMLEEGVLNLDENSQQNMWSQYVDLYDQPKGRSKRKREFVEKTKWPKHRTSTLGGRSALSYGNKHLPELENEFVHPNKRSSHNLHPKANTRMSKTESRQPFGGLSKELQSRLSKPIESGSNNIKARLKFPRFVPRLHGPMSSKLMKGNVNQSPSISQPCVKVKSKSVKKGHKSSPYIDVNQDDPQVSHPGLQLEPQKKLITRSSETKKDKGPSLEADLGHSILKVKPTENDPPENSEELKNQVDHWFLKCMLYLNANPGRRKKFMELGNAGTLKCIICSSGKEFAQTKDVATHAFTSLKVGLRAPHLGFHKALCFLMGWDPQAATNGRWVCKSLPDIEARTLKEDIILWPPVFVIHSSVRDFYDNDQVKVSIEQLENILRDMGLSEGKASICYGKSGNPNIMLVKFSGTLSGLQEAQRLHNVFAEKKHGKTELLEITANGGSGKQIDQDPENKVEDVVYGYLGIVEDFDKLNFDMRQRYVAKSKKEILDLVDDAI